MSYRNLVVVRAGGSSLHDLWIDQPYHNRNFELLISYYCEEAYARFVAKQGLRAVLIKGGKWDGLYKTLKMLDLDAYDRIWLPDDDIAACTDKINAIFTLSKRYGLAVAQPSLSRDSYFSHFIFSHCQSFRLRYTNYVEIMVPCLTSRIVKQTLPYFENSMSGFGLDYIWCRFSDAGAYRVAILDAIEVHHTRPVGHILRAAMEADGSVHPEEEEARLKAQFGLTGRTVPIAFSGVLKNGKPVIGRLGMAFHMAQDWFAELNRFQNPCKAAWGILKIIRRQVTKRLELQNF